MDNKKLLITGNFGVGKSSLFQRFLDDTFDNRYMTTVGIRRGSKAVELPDGRRLSIALWDLGGEVTQDKVPHAYFKNVDAIIYVYDLSRSMSYAHIVGDVAYLRQIAPGSLLLVVGNKLDLVDEADVARVRAELGVPSDFVSSAKTGEGIRPIFEAILAAL